MAIATAISLEVHLGGKLLFEDVSFKLEPRERMTLSGRNGAGKSTLLRVLAGELAPDGGTLSVQRGAKVALHDQRPPRESEVELGDYVFSGRGEMLATEAELAKLEERMSAGADEETMAAYAAAQQRLEAGGGYRWRDEVLAVLRGLGFDPEQAKRPLSTFSGGELTRASLARVLAARPDLLLLDEPTNHLDIPSLEWLERYLVGLDAAVVLVAHDRWFLEAVGTSVLELEAGRARFFAGPWHAWRKEQAARQIALGKAIERQQAEIARMERFVERFRYKATKARQAQSRVKAIEKAKRSGPASEKRDTRTLRFSFKPPTRPGRIVLKAVKTRIEVPGRTLLESAELELERGEHVVLIGPNGAGKTTLVETLAGQREPASGSIRRGHNVRLGYLSQHADTAAGEGTVLDAAVRETGLTPNKARGLLGGFLFSGDEVEKQLATISGGEQRRLSLAILVASGANVLVLDEPTNHLDVESREALEDALTEFEGSVVLISHDRALLEAVGSRTLVCEDGRLESHQAGWAEYQRRRDEEGEDTPPSVDRGGRQNGEAPGARRQRSVKTAQKAARRVTRLERQIATAEAELREVEDELSDPGAWASPGRYERATERHAAAKRAVEELYEEWEDAQADVEAAPASGSSRG
jgi:ATP-binding cassette subfamily F protein 3